MTGRHPNSAPPPQRPSPLGEVVFLRDHRRWKAGEMAAVTVHLADELVMHGIAWRPRLVHRDDSPVVAVEHREEAITVVAPEPEPRRRGRSRRARGEHGNGR